MAGTIQLRAPEAFNFKKPDEWLKWHRRFEQYRVASGLSAESKARQVRVSTLLYCMGEEAEDVLTSTNITTEERKDYDTVNTLRFAKMSFLKELGLTAETMQLKGNQQNNT